MTPTRHLLSEKRVFRNNFLHPGVIAEFATPYPHHYPLSAENQWLEKTMLVSVSIGISEGQNEPTRV